MENIPKNILDEMDFNGYAYFNKNAFDNNTSDICYIPENAESLDDCYTKQQLIYLVNEWCLQNNDYLEEHETNPTSILNLMWEDIEWTFPTTWLDQLINY